ncbi:hypothetical protein [Algoriphagus formosus]|uniref:hypothetical protein n=1 Tax=Algoriphagus formosus TaxID=2007308 RepID=UPI000C29576D|nr:hypothetical protein [Algoriphagus formosus]
MKATKPDLNLDLLKRALLKIHPEYCLFLNDFLEKLQPIIYREQSLEEAHFIHLVGFENKLEARKIITDVIELLQWQNETIFLWESADYINGPSQLAQTQALQENFSDFPGVLVTDGLWDFFHEVQFEDLKLCENGKQIVKFLSERRELDLSEFRLKPLQARGNLIVSYIPNFESMEYDIGGGLIQYLWDSPEIDFERFRKDFYPIELRRLVEKNYVRREDLIFFSKDESFPIQYAMDLISLCPVIETYGSQILGFPVKLTCNALSYFHFYVFYKKLSYAKLKKEAIDFFEPIFRQYPRMVGRLNGLQPEAHEIILDFKGGWRFSAEVD